MRKIDTFNEFRINEAEDSPRSKEALINVFFETLEEVVNASDMNVSYSGMAQNTRKNQHDPAVDFKVMLALFEKHGWTKKALTNFFQKYGKDVIELYDNGSHPGFTSFVSAGSDIFLYYMAKPSNKVFQLAGYDYADAAKTQGFSEFWIKFGYGYQNTKYGKLVIEQQLGELDKWYALANKYMMDGLFSEDDFGNIENFLPGSEWDTPRLKSLVKKGIEWDGKATIKIDLTNVSKDLNEADYAKFKEEFVKQLNAMGFDMGINDNYRLGGTGVVKGNVIKLTLKK